MARLRRLVRRPPRRARRRPTRRAARLRRFRQHSRQLAVDAQRAVLSPDPPLPVPGVEAKVYQLLDVAQQVLVADFLPELVVDAALAGTGEVRMRIPAVDVEVDALAVPGGPEVVGDAAVDGEAPPGRRGVDGDVDADGIAVFAVGTGARAHGAGDVAPGDHGGVDARGAADFSVVCELFVDFIEVIVDYVVDVAPV